MSWREKADRSCYWIERYILGFDLAPETGDIAKAIMAEKAEDELLMIAHELAVTWEKLIELSQVDTTAKALSMALFCRYRDGTTSMIRNLLQV